MPPSPARAQCLAALREQVRALESGSGERRDYLPFGIEAVDSRLAGGGLAVDALHEAAGARSGPADEAAATLFLAAIAARREGMVLWALARRDLFAPALAAVGLAPDRLLYAECGRDEDVLAVMEEGLRHGGLAAVVGETRRAVMAATRRLQLAAEEGGTPALMLRRWRGNEDPLAAPSAAITRWRLACAPSAPLPVAGIGRPRWRLALARQRGGEPFELLMESPDAEGRLALSSRPEHREGEERRAA
ncbi:MAG: ImuA family protein [Allosphingosinicella sp.]